MTGSAYARGNDVLLRTVKYICDLFKHSPVYRVGGDEFVVILQNQDYSNRESILSQLKPWNRKRNFEDDRPWDQLAFASGFSAYDPEKRHQLSPCIPPGRCGHV